MSPAGKELAAKVRADYDAWTALYHRLEMLRLSRMQSNAKLKSVMRLSDVELALLLDHVTARCDELQHFVDQHGSSAREFVQQLVAETRRHQEGWNPMRDRLANLVATLTSEVAVEVDSASDMMHIAP